MSLRDLSTLAKVRGLEYRAISHAPLAGDVATAIARELRLDEHFAQALPEQRPTE
jgi:hypothetical protein